MGRAVREGRRVLESETLTRDDVLAAVARIDNEHDRHIVEAAIHALENALCLHCGVPFKTVYRDAS
jgi:hypothetical protein